MLMLVKITAKGQATIPRALREALGVKPGDTLAWAVDKDGVARVRRVEAQDGEYLQALQETLPEWSSVEDDAAYANL